MLGLLDALKDAPHDGVFAGIINIMPTFRSLTVHYDPARSEGLALGEALLSLAQTAQAVSRTMLSNSGCTRPTSPATSCRVTFSYGYIAERKQGIKGRTL